MVARTVIPPVREFTWLIVGGLVVVLVGAIIVALSLLSASDNDTRFAAVIGGAVALAGFVMVLFGLARLLDALFDFLAEARDRRNASS
ncbi:hypothetical protein [Cellulomonas alba]|uniref:Uncharacterized protein n=1 Tax=Cellulomonas alba TaxID=3053467 RepID=A0ABT7SM17_9CELL|nr:hypothetical protein [Cellulomonas alba]MDM7856607.1 hypothetical protein [Cellulomonas alba]